jgi:GNAT superfamily N-acetyltransferase
MSDYRVRTAAIDDVPTLVHHRTAMFQDMGVEVDVSAMDATFRPWLLEMIPNGVYRAWLVESASGVVAGGGVTILPWPPGPGYPGGRVAFVYNMYTEPAHRQLGLARLVMETIHAWCRQERIGSLALNASRAGQPLYDSLGYSVTPSPMMFLALE